VLVHANREVAQHILAEPLLPLDLVEGGRRRFNIEQGEMCLAILTQTVGEDFTPTARSWRPCPPFAR